MMLATWFVTCTTPFHKKVLCFCNFALTEVQRLMCIDNRKDLHIFSSHSPCSPIQHKPQEAILKCFIESWCQYGFICSYWWIVHSNKAQFYKAIHAFVKIPWPWDTSSLQVNILPGNHENNNYSQNNEPDE